jgi:hypothetical protein
MIRAPNTLALLERTTGLRVFVVALVLLVAVHPWCLQDPPYWDALMGAFAQGHWLATHSFSPVDLLRDGGAFQDGGACVYPYSVYPWITGGFEALGIAPATTFLVLHVVSLVAAAAIVAGLFRLVRDEAGRPLALLVACALLVQPMFRALACQMNMDVLLTACTVLSIGALTRGKHVQSSAWSTLAFFIKPTAIILVAGNIAALVLRSVRPAWFGIDGTESVTQRRRRRASLLVHAGLFVLFLIELAVSAHFGKSAEGVAFFGGFTEFVTRRLWTLPEFALALIVFLATIPWLAVRTVRGRASALEIDLALFLLAYTGFFFQYGNVLPRYYLQAWPILLAALLLAALHARIPRRAVAGALGVFALVALINAHGRFYPERSVDWNDPRTGARLVPKDGWLLERSLEYRDDMLCDEELARAVQARAGLVVVSGWPLTQALAVPAFGYVLAPVRLASTSPPITYVFPFVARAQDLDPSLPTLRVLSPNVFDGPTSRVLPGDEILDVVEHGRLRAFLVKRTADSGAERR